MKYFTLILFAATLVCCKQPVAKKEAKDKYFEGFVEFENSWEGKDANFIALSKKTVGIKAITYIGRDGFFSREYIDSNNIIIDKEIYRPDSLKVYFFKPGKDTIRSYDVTRNNSSTLLGIDKQIAFKILNHNVDIINVRKPVKVKAKGLEYYVYSTYYNDVNYSLNPLSYKRYAHNNVEEIFTKSPYITTGYKIVHGDRMTHTSIATRIVPEHVEEWHFEIPKNKIIIERFY